MRETDMNPTAWEYEVYVAFSHSGGLLNSRTIDTATFKAALNHLGAQGWELVSVVDINTQGTLVQVVATFKRPRLMPPDEARRPPLPSAHDGR